MSKILIKNGRIWNGENFLHADVLTVDNRIAKIEPKIAENADFIYDALGMTVSAGLVDAHIHIKGISDSKFGINPEICSFPFGVTAAIDAGAEHGDKDLLDSFLVKNAVFTVVGIKKNRADLTRIEEQLSKYGDKVLGLKLYFDTTVSEVTDITPLKQVCEFARTKGLRVMVHSSHTPVSMIEVVKTLDSGDILTHAFHGGENNLANREFIAAIEAKRRGVILDVGMAGNVHTDFMILKNAIATGVIPDIISTDITRYSAYIRGGRYGMTMCMNIAKTLGMSEADVFKSVTSTPSRVLGKKEEWGNLKVGAVADIAVFEYSNEGFDLTDDAGNHVYNTKGYRCVLTVADGQVVYRN